MSIFHLPDVGEGLQEAEIVSWHVAIGDRVVTDQPLVSIETDKAVVELPSPHSGIIVELNAEVGDVVEVGAPLVEFATDEKLTDQRTVIGTFSAVVNSSTSESETGSVPASTNRPKMDVKASPSVRALARNLGVALKNITPTGARGNITAEDVNRARKLSSEQEESQEHAGVKPLRGVRRAMAQHMAASHSRIVPALVVDEANISDWLKDENITPRLIRALVSGCNVEPLLNSWFDDQTMTLRYNKTIDLGIAVDSKDGLIVPVLRDAGNRDPANLLEGLARIKEDVSKRVVPQEDLKGHTITLSNYGPIGGRYAQMIVVPPQVAILGAGRTRKAMVVVNDEPIVGRVLPISLTFDHRVIAGGEAARFLNAVIEDLEKPS